MNLIEQLKECVGRERKIFASVIRLLEQVEETKTYARYGFSSVYKLCTRELLYSEGAAYRRVSAMHLIRRNKSWIEKIETGELSLTNAAKLETALRVAELRSLPVDGHALVESVFGLSSKAADRKIEEAGLKPEGKLPAEIEEKIAQLKVLLGDPRASREELLLFALNEAIASHQPPLGDIAKEVRSPEKRHVPEKLSEANHARSQHTCQFVSPITGVKCDEPFYLENDHIVPFALGGKTEAENLRVLCRTHNLFMASEMGLGWPRN